MSQKAENLLNLALDATSEEREKSLELEVGYQPLDQEWDLIIKYSGNLEAVREIASSVTELSNEYAILTVPESRIEQLAQIPEIEYIEKPKRLFFEAANGKRVSCILPVQTAPLKLFGAGILKAVIDSGIDYSHSDFRNPDGTTRIRALWDQSISGNPPEGYFLGTDQCSFVRAGKSQTGADRTKPGYIRAWHVCCRGCGRKRKRQCGGYLYGSGAPK